MMTPKGPEHVENTTTNIIEYNGNIQKAAGSTFFWTHQ